MKLIRHFCLLILCCFAANPATLDQILSAYVNAVGGQSAIDKITTRELKISPHHQTAMKVFWQAPDHALREGHRERAAYDGANAWFETKRKKIQRLPHARQDELETDANPIRFVHLKDLYAELNVEADADGMAVISAPNKLGATKFFFDQQTHLLARIEEFGSTSAYFKHTTEFEDYKDVDGIKLPHRILRSSEEPGSEEGDVKLSDIKQNVAIDPTIFRKPDLGRIIGGGKH